MAFRAARNSAMVMVSSTPTRALPDLMAAWVIARMKTSTAGNRSIAMAPAQLGAKLPA